MLQRKTKKPAAGRCGRLFEINQTATGRRSVAVHQMHLERRSGAS
jgi:hypothetical protein